MGTGKGLDAGKVSQPSSSDGNVSGEASNANANGISVPDSSGPNQTDDDDDSKVSTPLNADSTGIRETIGPKQTDNDDDSSVAKPPLQETEIEIDFDPIVPFDEERNLENHYYEVPTESTEPKSPRSRSSLLETQSIVRNHNVYGSTRAVDDDAMTVRKPEKMPKKKEIPKKKKHKKSLQDEELIRLALHRNPYFTCLDEEQIQRFVDEAELVDDFRPGQAVIVEGPSRPVRRPGKTRLRKMKTNMADVHGDDYFDEHDGGRGGSRAIGVGNSPADVDDPWWIEEDDDTEYGNYQSNDNEKKHYEDAAASRSSYLYIIRKGKADIFYETINPATLGPSRMFGEGGFLFGRNHSASVVAATDQLECFRIDRHTFVSKILPSQNMKRLYRKYSSMTSGASTSPSTPTLDTVEFLPDEKKETGIERLVDGNRNMRKKKTKEEDKDGEEKFVMTMDDFLEFFKKERDETSTSSSNSSSSSSLSNPSLSPIANAYQSILRGTSSTYHDEKNHIALEDFCFFHFLMARPDPEIDIAFILMDRSRSGTITRRDFERYLETSVPHFAPNSEFLERHFGNGRVIRSHQFSQFLHDLQRELGRQAFLYRAKELAKEKQQCLESSKDSTTVNMADPHIGYLPAEIFIEVLTATSSWRLPDGIIDRLESLYCKPSIDSAESTALASVRAGTIKGDSPKQVAEYSRRSVLADLERRRNKLGTRNFAYVDFIAFQDLLVQLPAICNLIERSCQIKKGPISQDDFKVANRVLGIGGRLSRQQVNIIFELFDLDHDGYLSNEDAISVCGLEIGSNVLEAVKGRDGKATFAPPPNYPQNLSLNDSGGYGYNDDEKRWENMSTEEWMMSHSIQFFLSSIAGGFGIFTVYPLDLIKTRMMNQRAPSVDGKRLYYTSLDCLQKVIRYEGFQGLYRGLLPPLLAAGPEKFVKITVNDMLRGVLSKDNGSSTQWLTEIVSGGCAGACQLLVTNPLEIVKIRMQLQGETSMIYKRKGFEVPRGLGLHYMSFTQIIQDFGTTGLYKGAAACLMRDIPFGAIYFPAYAACMDYLVNRDGSAGASSSSILISGTLAAIPASLLTNPMDLVKTRLQVASRPGEERYSGIGDCIRKVYKTEGHWAFFKGSFPRVARIAPQFGLSLFAYEKLSQLIGFRGIAPPTNAPVNPRDYRTAFSSVSSGIESKAIDAESLIENIGLFKPPR